MKALLKNCLLEIILYFLILLFFFFNFYSKWGLWEDQGIFHYMAWGIQHGMIPYVDIINMNWPGIALIHLIGRLISGASPYGIRLIETVLIFVLSISSTIILSSFKVPFLVRFISLSSYLLCYFSTGYLATLQREGFALPFFILGMFPWLISKNTKLTFNKYSWIFFGMISCFGLFIKPTFGLISSWVILFNFLFYRTAWKEFLFKLKFFFLGTLFIVFGFTIWLYLCGGLEGFIFWGIKYAFGPYTRTNHPWNIRWEHTMHILTSFEEPTFLLTLGSIFLFITNRYKKMILEKEFILFLGIIVSSLASILLQGKTHCEYHFIPLQWAISIFAAIQLAYSNITEALPLSFKKLLFVFCISSLLGLSIDYSNKIPGLTCGTLIAKELKRNFSKDKTVVTFGFFPTFLSEFEHKTPFPYIDSEILYRSSNPGSVHRKRIRLSLAKALKDSSVKEFILQKGTDGLIIADGLKLQKVLLNFGYHKHDYNGACKDSFDFYER